MRIAQGIALKAVRECLCVYNTRTDDTHVISFPLSKLLSFVSANPDSSLETFVNQFQSENVTGCNEVDWAEQLRTAKQLQLISE